MVVETMVQQGLCQDCSHKKDCQEVYEKLGHAEGPSVVSNVVVAFLSPILTFIISLAVCQRILARAIEAKGLLTAVSFLLAVSVTSALVLVITRCVKHRAGPGNSESLLR